MIAYLDDFLILGKTFEETILSRNAVIYLLQNQGFFINLKKVLHPTQRIEFLGMIIDSVEMIVSVPQEKVESISKRCRDILPMQEVSIKDLVKVLAKLSSTAITILPARLYIRYLQRQKIDNLCLKRDCSSKVILDSVCKVETHWWISIGKRTSANWEASNFSSARTFDTVRYIKDELEGFRVLRQRRSMVSRKTGCVYKYNRTKYSKICDNYILQI